MEPNLGHRWTKCRLRIILKYSFVGFFFNIFGIIFTIQSEFHHYTEFIVKNVLNLSNVSHKHS